MLGRDRITPGGLTPRTPSDTPDGLTHTTRSTHQMD